MTERIVDRLEVIEVETTDRDVVCLVLASDLMIQLVLELDPVRQAGQRIVMRHVFDLRLSTGTLFRLLLQNNKSSRHRSKLVVALSMRNNCSL